MACQRTPGPLSTLTAAGCRGRAATPRRGLSMVELLVALAIAAVLLGGVLPMLKDLRTSQRLMAAASLLETDIHLARSEAIRTGRVVRLAVVAPASGGSCYVLHDGGTGACTCVPGGPANCAAGVQLLRSESQPVGSGVVLAALGQSLAFDGRKGTVTPTATLRLSAPDGRAVHQIVNIMGRVRSCAAGGRIGGLRACD